MMSIESPPFCGAPVGPAVSTPRGGPMHDAEQRLIDVFLRPDSAALSAGKLGSSLRDGPDCRGNVAAAERWRWAAFERWMKRRTSQF